MTILGCEKKYSWIRPVDDLFYKYSRNLSNDVNGSLESSDLPFFFPNEDERARLFRGRSHLPFRLLSSFTVYPLVAIYPAKSYFRWKFIALARIEASFPGERNKENAVLGRSHFSVRRIIGAHFYRLSL